MRELIAANKTKVAEKQNLFSGGIVRTETALCALSGTANAQFPRTSTLLNEMQNLRQWLEIFAAEQIQ